MQNDFTRSLLNYSAERDDCIGRPERWGIPPPLVVNTPLHDEMAAVASEVWSGPQHLVWYFMIGGPGNGKSEAVGAFVRQLNSKAQSAGQPAVFDPAQGNHGGSIAYDFQGELPQGEMWLLQDVSVPKMSGSDPAADLLATLDLCADPGGHLLACANRGMLLRATRLARSNSAYAWLVPVLEAIDRQSQEAAVAAGAKWSITRGAKQIEIRVWPLDHESVLFGHGNGNPWAEPAGSLFDQIISKAAAANNWESKGCQECPARENCPMFGDALWLRDDQRRRSVLKILRNAEVRSGQRIVLREALGLVSMILVGCPSDFLNGAVEIHPCEWVQLRLTGNPARPKDAKALIELVSRRIYQDLFSRPTPTGLALDRAHQRRDEWVCEALMRLGTTGETTERTLKQIDSAFPKQAGPLRLVGRDGILHSFDPASDIAWCSRRGLSPDGTIAELRQLGGSYGLEQQLGNMLQALEDEAKALEPHKDPAKVFAALYRWASTLYLRIAGTAAGDAPSAETFADYLALLQQPTLPIEAAGRQITLRDLMKAAAETGQKVKMAPDLAAELPSVQLKPSGARPRSDNPRWPANDRLLLQVSGGAIAGPSVVLTAATFLDTWRKHVLEIADWNISPAMDTLMRAWRDDFIVTKAQFRNLQALEFNSTPPLEFDFISPTAIQVRPK